MPVNQPSTKIKSQVTLDCNSIPNPQLMTLRIQTNSNQFRTLKVLHLTQYNYINIEHSYLTSLMTYPSKLKVNLQQK